LFKASKNVQNKEKLRQSSQRALCRILHCLTTFLSGKTTENNWDSQWILIRDTVLVQNALLSTPAYHAIRCKTAAYNSPRKRKVEIAWSVQAAPISAQAMPKKSKDMRGVVLACTAKTRRN